MATRILTDEEMAEARRLYEREGWGYGRLAEKYGVTKPTAQGWARRGGWQRAIGVAPKQNAATEAKAGEAGQANLTGMPKNEPPEGRIHTPVTASHTESRRVVSGVFVAPRVGESPLPADAVYTDELRVPDGLDEWEREEWIKAAIVQRQKVINARHLRELQAARSKIYAAIKTASEKGGAGAALAVQRVVAALRDLQEGEMQGELQRVRLEVSEFVGKPVKQTPARIFVHMQAGEQIGAGAAAYGPNAVEVINIRSKS